MKTTTDTLTGKPFRWNSTVYFTLNDGRSFVVPARFGKTYATHLHPDRVPADLLAKLNPVKEG